MTTSRLLKSITIAISMLLLDKNSEQQRRNNLARTVENFESAHGEFIFAMSHPRISLYLAAKFATTNPITAEVRDYLTAVLAIQPQAKTPRPQKPLAHYAVRESY